MPCGRQSDGCWPLGRPEGPGAAPLSGVPAPLRRPLELLAVEPRLAGVIARGVPFPPLAGARRIPPHAALTGRRVPWGDEPGLLDQGGLFTADLDLLPPEAQAILAQRLDAGGCALAAACTEPPWAHLADRVAFLVLDAPPPPRPPRGRPLTGSQVLAAIAGAAARLQVEGHRAEEFAYLTAEAIARAGGRRRLYEGDVAEAILLVLAPRSRAVPEARRKAEPEGREHGAGQRSPEPADAPARPVPEIGRAHV